MAYNDFFFSHESVPDVEPDIRQAWEEAKAMEPPAFALRYDRPETRQLVNLCRLLQERAGDSPFPLTARTVSRLLCVNGHRAWRLLKFLELDRVLKLVYSGSGQKPNRYRYVGRKDCPQIAA